MARVVVTGGAGFLGSHLSDRLLDRGDAVVCVDNLSTGSVANIERLHAENPEGAVIIQADELASVKTFTEVLDQARQVVPPERVSLATEQ